jgi:hypothetical protein
MNVLREKLVSAAGSGWGSWSRRCRSGCAGFARVTGSAAFALIALVTALCDRPSTRNRTTATLPLN